MGTLLKVIQSVTSKDKSLNKLHQTADELDYLITLNQSVTQAIAHTMQDLSGGVFINMANLTLSRRDSCLEYLNAGIKQDILMSLRTAPIHMCVILPEDVISKAEEEIRHHEDKCTYGPAHKNLNVSTPTVKLPNSSKTLTGSLVHLHGGRLGGVERDPTGARPPLTLRDWPRVRKIINDNHCLNCVAGKSVCVHVTGKVKCSVSCVTSNRDDSGYVTRKRDSLVTEMVRKKDCLFVTSKKATVNTSTVNSCAVVTHVHFANGYPQKKARQWSVSRNKICERCFLCGSLDFCKKMSQMSKLLFQIYLCRGQITQFLEKMGSPRHPPQSFSSPQRRLHSPLPVPEKKGGSLT